jgi:hypothetical protein
LRPSPGAAADRERAELNAVVALASCDDMASIELADLDKYCGALSSVNISLEFSTD